MMKIKLLEGKPESSTNFSNLYSGLFFFLSKAEQYANYSYSEKKLSVRLEKPQERQKPSQKGQKTDRKNKTELQQPENRMCE